MLVLLGAWYAVQGTISWPLTFAAVTAGAVGGAFIDHRLGAYLGPRIDRTAARRGALSAERLARFEASYRRYGALLLLGNRFLPGIRAFLFVAAGAVGIPTWKVLLYGGISATAWNAVLLGAGALVARSLPELADIFSRYDSVATGLLLAAAALLAAALLVRRLRKRGQPRVGR